MAGANASNDEVRHGLIATQALQEAYDEVGWKLGHSSHEKLRHLCLHLAKTVGLFAALSEQFDHGVEDGNPPTDHEVAEKLNAMSGRVADLASFAAQISTLANADLGELFLGRLQENINRFAPNSDVAKRLRTAERKPSAG